MKKKLIIANWKLNGNKKTIKKKINKLLKSKINTKKCTLSIAPPMIYLHLTTNLINKNTNISLTSQNIDKHITGSFTGEISGKMLKDVNVKYVIIGHSERKKYHLENNKIIYQKIKTCLNTKLIPILCIGENKIEYEKNKSINICKNQIKYSIPIKEIKKTNKIIIAYEPIWAIGTGISANINHINNVYNFIKNYVQTKYLHKIKKIKIIYGGSVNIQNIYELINNTNIDGFLIGSSSLITEEFIKIINIITNKK